MTDMALIEDTVDGAAVRFSEATPGDYFALLKPRVMRLVVFTAFVGMVLAPGALNPVIGLIAILCIAIGAGASGALNMWYDADIDAVMRRTRARPVPAGRVTAQEALAFGLVLSGFSVMTMGLLVNWVSAAFLAFTIAFYVLIYTMWLKRWTPQNIVIGGAAGAFPPMIGWTAVTGDLSWQSAVLFLIIFLWTPPHFWALALFKIRDYDNAHVPMLPNVAGLRATRNQIFAYSLLLAVAAVLPSFTGIAGIAYGVVAALLSANFVWRAWRVWRSDEGPQGEMAAEKALFFCSLYFLFGLFAALLVEGVLTRLQVFG